MPPPTSTPSSPTLPLSRLAAVLAMLTGALVLLGWILDIPIMKSLLPGAVQMKANTAVAFLAVGASLYPSGSGAAVRWTSPKGLLAMAVMLLGASTLAEYLSGVNFGIDELLFADKAHAFNSAPGRMSPLTAWAFLMTGACLMLRGGSAGHRTLIIGGSVQVMMIGTAALLGYLWNAVELVTDAWLPPVAMHTAVVLLVVGSALYVEHGARSLRPRVRQEESVMRLERRLVLGFWGMVAVLLVTATFTYRSNLQYVRAAELVAHTQEVRVELARLQGCMQGAEASQRQFIVMGDSSSLDAFYGKTSGCDAVVRNIGALVEDNPSQMTRIATLAHDVPARLGELADGAEIYRSRGLEAARAAIAAEGNGSMRKISDAIAQMDAAEKTLLRDRERVQTYERSVMLASLVVTILVASTIFSLLARGMGRQLRSSTRLREEAKHQRALLAAVINSIPDSIAYKGADGTHLGANAAYERLVGPSLPEDTEHEFFPVERASGLRMTDREVLASPDGNVEEAWVTAADGRRIAMEVVRTPLRGPDGDLEGLLAIGRNVTHRKQAEEEMVRAREMAEEAARTKSDFLANMSHEIRTPLTGVLGMIDALAAEDLTATQKGYVERVRLSGRHLLNVINDILDFSKIEAGKLELESIDFSVEDLLEGVALLVRHLAVERGLDLRIQLDEGVPAVLRGDPTRLTQVLLNLVSNAIKFTREGEVVVRATGLPGGGGVRFEVCDSGVGIDAPTLARLFAPFVQADNSTARRFGGSGLGLAISKRLVEAMGGSIGATSEPGRGSRFFFDVPLVAGDAGRVIHRVRASATPLAPRRILIAEDVEINRDVLRAALGRQGHELVFAMNGQEAVDLVRTQVFDIVLMDVQMPVMDGVEATRRIRKLRGPGSAVPIIGLTANVMASERQSYVEAGMNECLTKPIEWDELSAAIGRYEPSAAGSEPLVDRKVLAAVERAVGAAQLALLAEKSLDACDAWCASMRAHADGDPDQLAAGAHKMKGSAGTFGFHAISGVAARIESSAREGHDARLLLDELDAAIRATRVELAGNDPFPTRAA